MVLATESEAQLMQLRSLMLDEDFVQQVSTSWKSTRSKRILINSLPKHHGQWEFVR
ncbi:hypothetical protein ACFL5F_04185 [Planctomycetota bacterium]